MKKVESNRLLDLYSGAFRAFRPNILDADIAATPEIVHIMLLAGEQLLEPLGRDAIHCPLGTAAEFLR